MEDYYEVIRALLLKNFTVIGEDINKIIYTTKDIFSMFKGILPEEPITEHDIFDALTEVGFYTILEPIIEKRCIFEGDEEENIPEEFEEIEVGKIFKWVLFEKKIIMTFQNERQVADQAKRMLETALRSKVSSFGQHTSGNKVSIQDVSAVAKVSNYENKSYMRSLSIRMGKHGFIQHYGVDITRTGGIRKRKKPRPLTYNFSSHYFKMKPTPFINTAVEQSRVIDFVMENIIQIRTEEIFFDIRRILENQTIS